jgi:hypothetical protein
VTPTPADAFDVAIRRLLTIGATATTNTTPTTAAMKKGDRQPVDTGDDASEGDEQRIPGGDRSHQEREGRSYHAVAEIGNGCRP